MDSTNIECKLLREGGTRAEIGGTEYHFEPLADGAHVAAVSNDDHIARFLSITDAYRLYRGKESPKGKPVKVAAPSAAPAPVAALVPEPAPAPVAVILEPASPTHPASFDIHGAAYSLDAVTDRARVANGFDEAAWSELSSGARADMIDEELEAIAAAGPQAAAAKPTLEELRVTYKAKSGKKAHHSWTAERIAAELAK